MKSWLDQFTQKKEALSDHFRTPVWFRPFAEITSVPGAAAVTTDLWSTADGYYVHARDSLLQQDGTERRFTEPVVLIAFFAASLEAVQWHRHVLKSKPRRASIVAFPPEFPQLSYAEWTARFEFSESASYRIGDGSGAFVDKTVAIGQLSVCFLSRKDDATEKPYLFEIRHDHRKKA